MASDPAVRIGAAADLLGVSVETIRRWWDRMGRRVYPQAKKLLITADGGEAINPDDFEVQPAAPQPPPARPDGVDLTQDQAECVGEARLRGEVIHDVVQKHAGAGHDQPGRSLSGFA